MKTIGIFPASGGLGESIYTHLLKLVPADKVTLISRHPEKIPEEHITAGVHTRQASYESPASELQAAFSGIEVLLLISHASHEHQLRTKLQLPVIDAARHAGVSHIFYSSLAFAGTKDSTTSVAEVMHAHLDTESYLASLATQDPSFTYTIIRQGLYAESTELYTAFFDARNPVPEILIPHDGAPPGIAWVKRDELGEASARLLARYAGGEKQFPYVNATVLFTGPWVWSLEETVKELARLADREVRIREVSVDEFARLPKVLDKYGSVEGGRTWATAFDAIRAGEAAVVTKELEEVLGRRREEFEVTATRFWS
ncbi:hypothetical protein B0T22DRAFT_540357 [Podospora appendiculata]|uniref:NAD(P)-binding domain-containing protein n=1 Tax=Podospora appendiculata TaxID=314037 RepID=A0AAE1C744_9PEZI|nr:hypothetical protein B0T22DRAFT_540357 [Podospora appendiculata]